LKSLIVQFPYFREKQLLNNLLVSNWSWSFC